MRFVDYTIQPFTGQLLFRQPVPSLDENFNPVSIRVLYEVESGGRDYGIYGGEATLTPASGVTLGISANRDENPASPRGLASAHFAVRPWDGLVFTGEVAHSDSGGALFDGTRKGEAWRGEAHLDHGRVTARAFAQRSERRFDNASSAIPSGREELGADARLQLAATWVGAHLLRTEDLRLGGRRDGFDGTVGRHFGVFDTEAGYRWVHEGDAPATPTMSGLTPSNISAIRGRIGANLPGTRQPSLFAEFMKDVEHDRRNRLRLGGDIHVTPSTRVYLRHENLASFGGSFALNDAQRLAETVVGIASDEHRDGYVFSEYRSRDAFAGRDLQAAMGLRNRWLVSPGLRFDGSLEHVEVIRGGAGTSTSITSGIEYTRNPLLKSTGRIEYHRQVETDQWLVSGNLARKLSRNWTGLAQTTWFWTPTEKRADARSSAGLAWRQTDRNIWDALARYENHLERTGLAATRIERVSNTLVSDINWHPVRAWTLSGQGAANWKRSESGRSVVYTDAQLLGARALVDLTPRTDAGLIGRGLFSDHFGTRQGGLGAEIGVLVCRDLRVAAGYNVFGIRNDDLTAGERTDRGPYIRIGFKFGESLLGRSLPRNDDRTTPPLGLSSVVTGNSPTPPVDPTRLRLTPLARRTTDEVIARDLAALDAVEACLDTLPGAARDTGRTQEALAWIEVARAEYTENDESTFADSAFALSQGLLVEIQGGATPTRPDSVLCGRRPIGTDHPRGSRVGTIRYDLWEQLDMLSGTPCACWAVGNLPRMKVELIWAAHEDDCESDPHVAEAERLGREAAHKLPNCLVETPSADTTQMPSVPEPISDTTTAGRAADAHASAAPDTMQRMSQPIPHIPNGVHFAFDRCDLGAISEQVLRKVATVLRSRPGVRVRLDGFTDIRGTSAYNRGLAACRVCAVRSYFDELGIDVSRITTDARGAVAFVSNERSVKGHALNRRVEITLIDEAGRVLPAEIQLDDLRIESRHRPEGQEKREPASEFPAARIGVCRP